MSRYALAMLVGVTLMQGAPFFEIDARGECFPVLIGTHVTDNGDGDGIADTDETLWIGITVQSHCPGGALGSCVAWLSTESPLVHCMRDSEILIGNLPGIGGVVTPDEEFEVRVGSVDRHDLGLGPEDPLEALLIMDIRCQQGSSVHVAQEAVRLQLDFNVLDEGQTPTVWGEDFEAGGVNPADPLQGTAFYAENLDAGLPGNNNAEGLINSDGWRCQYSDPDWHNAASYNHEAGEICYPGINLTHANAVYWRMDGSLVAGTPDGGRAHRGEKSMYFGIFLGQADEGFTTPTATVESVAMMELINLGADHPELSFWQQVSLVDHRSINADPMRNIDRGVVQIKLHDQAGDPISDWTTLQPIQNPYDQRSETNYYNCMFDPTDDGNTEDDFFDPTDPGREFGPSSTCYPGYSWAYMGSTTGAFSTTDVGYASTPPAESDAPSLGHGTWIETRVDLNDFKGRRAKLRFLVTGLRPTDPQVTNFGSDRDHRDDGWWIDDIEIDETLTEPAIFVNDRFLLGSCTGTGQPCIGQCRSSLAPCSAANPCAEGEGDCVSPCPPGEVCAGAPPEDCGADCTAAQVNLFVEPLGPLNPGSVTRGEHGPLVTVNFAALPDPGTGAEPSWLDACIDGRTEFRFCISGDPDGDLSGTPDADCDDAWDRPICETCSMDWDLVFAMTPPQEVVTTYAVEVRCSSAPDCRDGRTIEIDVECFDGFSNTYGLRDVRALNREMLTWRGSLDVDWLRGSFSTGADIGDYVADFTAGAADATSIPMDGGPAPGTGYYYLVKSDEATGLGSGTYYCSAKTWRSGGDREKAEPARDSAFGDP